MLLRSPVAVACLSLFAAVLTSCLDPTSSTLGGVLRAPVGAVVTLQQNGGDDLALTMEPFPSSDDDYNLLEFTFATALDDGSAWQVSVTSDDGNLACAVYAGETGTMPGGDSVRVGCEWRFDLVSRASDDTPSTFFEATAPVVGGDAEFGEGRFVAFVSSAAIDGATGAHRQVFWRDRLTGVTNLVSQKDGVEGDADSRAPALSADGTVIAFETDAENLGDDGNGVTDVYLRDVNATGAACQRVSRGPGGIAADGPSTNPSLSADGNRVAFESTASNLTDGVADTLSTNIFVRDVDADVTALISAAAGVAVGGARPDISNDGARIAFWSFSDALVAGDTNNVWDIFVADGGVISRVSTSNDGAEREQGDESASRIVAPSISGDGRFVAFATTAGNLVAGDDNGVQDVFVKDLNNGDLVCASVNDAGVFGDGDSPVGQGERIGLSDDGRTVVFTTAASNLTPAGAGVIVLRDLDAGLIDVVSDGSGGVSAPAVSQNGAYVVAGVGRPLDERFASTGLFSAYTGRARAWWWVD